MHKKYIRLFFFTLLCFSSNFGLFGMFYKTNDPSQLYPNEEIKYKIKKCHKKLQYLFDRNENPIAPTVNKIILKEAYDKLPPDCWIHILCFLDQNFVMRNVIVVNTTMKYYAKQHLKARNVVIATMTEDQFEKNNHLKKIYMNIFTVYKKLHLKIKCANSPLTKLQRLFSLENIQNKIICLEIYNANFNTKSNKNNRFIPIENSLKLLTNLKTIIINKCKYPELFEREKYLLSITFFSSKHYDFLNDLISNKYIDTSNFFMYPIEAKILKSILEYYEDKDPTKLYVNKKEEKQ